MTQPNEFLFAISSLLERLGIPYHVGGSVASSTHGMYRSSADIDFVIDPTSEQLGALADALEGEFYVSREAMAEALASRRGFNAIHVPTSFKLDFFVKGASPFDAEELRRSIRQSVGEANSPQILIKSPEDTVLRKLDWFRRGGHVSERQWHDVLSVLTANRGGLDDAYLDRWARELELTELLQRARAEVAGLS